MSRVRWLPCRPVTSLSESNRRGLEAGAHRDRFAFALTAVTLAGFVWRVGYVLALRHHLVNGDGNVFHAAGLDLANGVGFYDPQSGLAIAGHPPAWIVLLALPSLLSLKSWLAHQLFTTLVGTATIMMTGLAGRAAFGARVGLVAAALTAFSPFVWLYEREVLSEPLAMFFVAVTIWLAYRYRSRPGLALAIFLGLAVGAMGMTRAELVLASLLVVAPLILASSAVPFRRRLAQLAAAAAACVVVIAPWAIYNSTRFARPVPFSTGLGVAMYTGNCAPVYHGSMIGYYNLGCVAFVPHLSTDYSIADGQYRRQALKFMRKNKSRVPLVMAVRLGRTFGFYRPAQQMHLEAGERATPLWVVRLGFVVDWVLLPFAIAGSVLARRRRVPIYPLLAFVVIVIFSVLPTIGSVRYRAPAEIVLVILAALGIDALLGAWHGKRQPTLDL